MPKKRADAAFHCIDEIRPELIARADEAARPAPVAGGDAVAVERNDVGDRRARVAVQVVEIEIRALDVGEIRIDQHVLHDRMLGEQIRQRFVAFERALERARGALGAHGGVAPQRVDTAFPRKAVGEPACRREPGCEREEYQQAAGHVGKVRSMCIGHCGIGRQGVAGRRVAGWAATFAGGLAARRLERPRGRRFHA
ncbi:hypothetical protein OKW40_003625 [Paraburkholderia sp. RAU6.4a]